MLLLDDLPESFGGRPLDVTLDSEGARLDLGVDGVVEGVREGRFFGVGAGDGFNVSFVFELRGLFIVASLSILRSRPTSRPSFSLYTAIKWNLARLSTIG